MISLYLLPSGSYILYSFILILCVFFQAMALVITYYSRGRNRGAWPSIWLEIVILFYLMALVYRHGVFIGSANLGLVPDTILWGPRYFLFAVMVILVLIHIVVLRVSWPLFGILPAALNLPFMDLKAGAIVFFLFTVSLLYWLLRAVHIMILGFRTMRNQVTMYSLKKAIDMLPTAVLLYKGDGSIQLVNLQMKRLMTLLTGKVWRNGKQFIHMLGSGELEPGCRTSTLEGDLMCILPDGSAWLFHKERMQIRSKNLFQFTASDITERWMLFHSLQRKNQALEEKSADLKYALENLQSLSRNEEIKKAKMRAHDVLGQRLSLLLRAIRDDVVLAEDVLSGLSGNLLKVLKEESIGLPPEEELAGIIRTFAPIGVDITQQGDFPEDVEIGYLMVDIIRECISNAVRHGYATEICIEFERQDEFLRLKLSNNGQLPELPYKEGDGIRSMRRKIEPYNGCLDIFLEPGFTIQITLPGVK